MNAMHLILFQVIVEQKVNQVQKVRRKSSEQFYLHNYCSLHLGEPGRSIPGPPGIDGYPGPAGLSGAKGKRQQEELLVGNLYVYVHR